MPWISSKSEKCLNCPDCRKKRQAEIAAYKPLVLELHKQGLSIVKIAERIDLNDSTIGRWIVEARGA